MCVCVCVCVCVWGGGGGGGGGEMPTNKTKQYHIVKHQILGVLITIFSFCLGLLTVNVLRNCSHTNSRNTVDTNRSYPAE